MQSQRFLVEEFHKFYGEVLQLKRMVRLSSGSAADETVVWQRLLSYLERHGAIAARHGGPGARFYQEAQYVMVALGDEIFLHTPWSGRESWKRNLLEAKLFDSHVAGERIFQRIDKLLLERDSAFSELATIYLLALSLGFRGRYRGGDDGGAIAAYRRQLYAFIVGREPGLAEQGAQLFPKAAAHTIESEAVRKLPQARKWALAVVFAVVLYLFVGHELWSLATGGLKQEIARIAQILQVR